MTDAPAGPGGSATEGYMTFQEVCQYLAVSVETARYWRTKGGGPPLYKVGRQLRGRRSEIDAWVTEQRKAAS